MNEDKLKISNGSGTSIKFNDRANFWTERRARSLVGTRVIVWALAITIIWALWAGPLAAQDFFGGGGDAGLPPIRRLSGQELNYLMKVAREPLNALIEERPIREFKDSAAPGAINQSLPMAVTLWLNGQILARAWEIRQPQPLMAGTLSLANKVLNNPDQGRAPTIEEWRDLKVGIAVLHRLAEAIDDKEVKAGQAVVILDGFTIGLGLPKDMPGPKDKPFKYENSDLLSKACEMAGLRPGAWLLPDKLTILAADVDELIEN
jgi:hypothetical protein